MSEPEAHVPPFKVYYATVHDMDSSLQREFYQAFKASMLDGQPMDLDGQWSYAFALIHELATPGKPVGKAWEDPELDYRSAPDQELRLERALGVISETFKDGSLGSYARTWRSGMLFLRGDYQAGYEALLPDRVPLDIFMTLHNVIEAPKLTTELARWWHSTKPPLRKFGRENPSLVDIEVQSIIDAEHERLGQCFVDELWDRWFASRSTRASVEVDFGEFGKHLDLDRLVEVLSRHDSMEPNWPRPFQGFVASGYRLNAIKWPVPYKRTYHFETVVRARLSAMYRLGEDRARSRT